MLEDINVPISFSGGLDTKTDEKLVLPGKLTVLENGVFKSARKIGKRNGYTLIASLTAGSTLAFLRNELLAIGANRISSYSDATAAMVDKGPVVSVHAELQQIIRNSYQQTTPDIAISGNIALLAWKDSRGGVRATVLDLLTGTPILADTQVSATGKFPHCVAIGQYLVVVYADSTNLKYRKVAINSGTAFDAEATLFNDLNGTTSYFDVVETSNALAVTYMNGSSQITLAYVTLNSSSNLVPGTALLGFPTAITIAEAITTTIGLFVEPSTQAFFIVWHNTTNGLRYAVRNADFTSKVAATTVDATTSPTIPRVTGAFTSTTSLTLFYELNSANSYDHLVKTNTVNTAGGVGSASVLKRSVGLGSKAFLIGSDIYFIAAYDSTLQATYFMLKSDGTIVAKLLYTQGGGLPADNMLPTVPVDSALKAYFPASVKTKLISEANTTFTLKGVALEVLDFHYTTPFVCRELGENLHLSGGFVSIYDGASPVELGFHLFPENIATSASASGGSMATGTYLYYVVFAWIDNRGQLHRSAPSIAKSVAVTGPTGSVAVTVPTLRLTAKVSPRVDVMVEVYRTEANATTPYKVTSVSSPTFNNAGADTVVFTDTVADASIISNEILYTNGGTVENVWPGAVGHLQSAKNRLIATDLEDPLAWAYSREFVEGECINFSDFLTSRVDALGGKLYASAEMDEKVIFFKENHLFFSAGDGPDDTGGGGSFTRPQLIPSDVGSKYPNSIVLMPDGLMFKSNKGIYLLNRALQVQYVGDRVEAYNSQNITSAVLIADRNEVRFTTDSGMTLVYNYYFKDEDGVGQWATWSNHEASSAGLWKNQYVYLKSSGKIYKEAPGFFLDDNVAIKLKVVTAWIKTAGVQGFQRVRRAALLGEYLSPHTLHMQIGYNYEPSYPDRVLFDAEAAIDTNYYGQDSYYGESTVYGGVEDSAYQFRAHIKRQKCQSIRFSFEDVSADSPGQGYSLSDLTLQVAVKKGIHRLKPGKSLG